MTQTHTPGPWTVSPDRDLWGVFTIAEVEAEEGDNDQANARLIAAAPALLAALEAGTRLAGALLESGTLLGPDAAALDDWQADVTVDLLDA